MQLDANAFLRFFPDFYIQALDDKKLDKSIHLGGRPNEFKKGDLQGLNAKGAGIFFTPNRFKKSAKKEDCLGINSWFFEIDGISKEDQVKRINDSPIEPSLIVETRNSYHVYFLSDGTGTIENFERIQRGLICHFKSDKSITQPNRLMRIPGFFHNKEEPYEVRVVQCKEHRYSEDLMLKLFPHEEIEKEIPQMKDIEETEDLWDAIFWLDVKKCLERLSGTSYIRGQLITFENRSQGGLYILCDNKRCNAWIDENGRLGGSSAPSIIQWLMHEDYGNSKADIARIGKELFYDMIPEKHFNLSKIDDSKLEIVDGETIEQSYIDRIYDELDNFHFDILKTIPTFDDDTIFIRGAVTRIGAFSNIGKSRFAYWVTAKMLNNGYKGAIFSTEVVRPIVLANMVQHYDKVGFWDVMNKKHKATNGCRYSTRNLTIFDSSDGSCYLKDIRETIARHRKLDFIVIDFAQDVKDFDNNSNEYARMSEYARQVQGIAQEFNICIIDLSQVNNSEAMQKSDSESGYFSLKGSGDLFSKGDIILRLHRKKDEEGSPLEVSVRKHKYGKQPTYLFKHDFYYNDFTEASQSNQRRNI